jgi:hypothetical protein
VTTAPAPVDAIAAATQAGGGSLTQRAIDAALAGLTLDNAAQQAASPSVAAHQGALRAAQDSLHDPSSSAAFSPAALAQRASPLPAGADVQATQALSVPAIEAAAQTHNVAPPQAMPLQGVLAVPVALSTLQTTSAAGSARAQGAGQDERLTHVQRYDGHAREQHGDGAFDDDDDAPVSPDDSSPGEDQALADDRFARWAGLLTAAGQDEALRDVRLSRHVLLVLPQRGDAAATVPARAVLLGSRGAIELDAQWWPGAAADDDTAWQRFRLFRDGDLLLRGGMRTRAGNRACRLLLGAGSAAAADTAGGSIDAQAARLLLTERARVAQALLAQWTLLMLIVPRGPGVAWGAAHA